MLYFKQIREDEVRDEPPQIQKNQPLNIGKRDEAVGTDKFEIKNRQKSANHVIEEYPNIDIRSHREKKDDDEDEINIHNQDKRE